MSEAKRFADGLRKCGLCDDSGLMAQDLPCPRCGGPDSFERQAAAELERQDARIAELTEALKEHGVHSGQCRSGIMVPDVSAGDTVPARLVRGRLVPDSSVPMRREGCTCGLEAAIAGSQLNVGASRPESE